MRLARKKLWWLIGLLSLSSTTAFADPIVIQGPKQSQINTNLPDGGLPPVPGVQNLQIFRASRDRPDLTDGKGWTYNHHLDMAAWKGRLYVAWTSTEKDEDVWPWRQLYSTSTNGVTWSPPAELFPQGVSNPLRMYFFLAPNGHMLAIAGLHRDETTLANKDPDSLVVREILANHTLGPCYALLTPTPAPSPSFYTNSTDKAFVDACDALLANRPFLEQQDRGSLLGARRMKWHDSGQKNLVLKAMSLFHRQDGALVGICKNGWTTVSTDDGNTWSQPVIPPSLVTGTGKVWGQRTHDGRYALVYNPDKKNRYPLVMVTGDDGVTFGDMRVVHGELPPQRYAGEHKNVGPQYVRGISEWSNDGSWPDPALWVAYSVNKEDIWVSRIPLSSTPDAWNTYSPLWAPVAVMKDGVTLQDHDPYDYARATRLFPSRSKVTASFDVFVTKSDTPLVVTLLSGAVSRNPVSWGLPAKSSVGKRLRCRIEADATTHRFSLYLQNERIAPNVELAEWATNFTGISFSTGTPRPIPDRATTSVTNDVPAPPSSYTIQRLVIK
ncbi:MAG TPA: hypothetical protein VMP11_18725 [Verrucomicrobiae bacterium]|nr:hypothetical protein [Verrucomicrobiae bacterium]